jgi:hypothetical protein
MKTNGKRSGNEKISLNKKCGRCPPPLKTTETNTHATTKWVCSHAQSQMRNFLDHKGISSPI